MVSFLRTGEDAQKILEAEEREEAMRAAAKDKPYRFWIPKGNETQITFVDGDIDDRGNFKNPMFYEHNLKINGRWGNTFTCTEGIEPCPICEGDSKAYTAAAFTIIDHSEYTSKKDGKVYRDNVKLLVVKSGTRKDLLRLATKRGGLAGCTFDVSRKNEDKSPAVGDLYDFCAKLSPEEMVNKWGSKATPLEYEKEIGFISAEDLREALGITTPNTMLSGRDTSSKSYSDDL